MKSTLLSLLLAASCTSALAADATDLSEGEIRKVDKGAARLTIKHGELKNLDMPAMTMVFQVKDKAWLDKLKAGDKLRFRAEKLGSDYVVTVIELKAD
jgi:Cu/Ag efflux protein CusF